jgi:Possible lysine decarboxylase
VNEVKTYESSLTAPPERADKIFLEGPHSRFDEFVTLLMKAPLIKYSYAFVFMPGGAGTLDELDSVHFESLCAACSYAAAGSAMSTGHSFWLSARRNFESAMFCN